MQTHAVVEASAAQFNPAGMSKLFQAAKACGQTMASPISKCIAALLLFAHIKADILKSTTFGMIIDWYLLIEHTCKACSKAC